MSEQTARLVDRIRRRLHRALRHMTWAELAFGAAVAAGSVAAVWLVATLLEATLWLGTSIRTGLVLGGGALILGLAGTFVARPLGRLLGIVPGPSDEDVARTVGEEYPIVADRLVNLLQLAEGRSSRAPAPYVDRAVQHLADHIEEVKFEDVADFQPARRAARLALLPVVAVLAFLVAAPSTFLDASERLLAPRTEFSRPAPFSFAVTPGDTRVVEGDPLPITVRTSGNVPESATLLLRRQEDDSPQRIGLQADSMGTFRHTISAVRRPLRYRVAASPVRTKWHTVEVANRPFVRTLEVRIQPPAYTGRPSRTLPPNVGSITALPGSQIEVRVALAGSHVASGSLEFEAGPSQPLTVRGDSATSSFILQREGSYLLRLESEEGIQNRDPIRYETALQSDARPSVSFLQPETPTDLTPALVQPLRVQLTDDYGFRRVALFYRVPGTDSSFSTFELPLPAPDQTDQVVSHEWLLAQDSDLDLERGDEVVYFVRVWDNDTVNGPKAGQTATQRLRFPSLSEQYEELETLTEETGNQMENLQQESEAALQQFRNLRDELRRTREAEWEDRRQLERLRQQQNTAENAIEELSQQVEEMNRQRQRGDLSSQETAKQFQELKRAIDELKSPELQNALEQLRKSMQRQSFPLMQQPLENAHQRMEQRQNQLERVRNLFEQLKARQKLDELTRRAQEVSEQEEKIAEETEQRLDESARDDSTGQSERDAPPSQPSPSDSTSQTSPRPDSSAEATADSTSRTVPDSARTARPDSSTRRPTSPDSSANESLAREQEQTAEEMRKLMESMQESEQTMQDVPSSPSKQLQKLNQQLQQENLPEQMRENSRKLRQNRLQNARRGQQQIQNRLQQLQSQLSSMRSQMSAQQRQMNMAGLRNALENTLQLSRQQEDLRRTVEQMENGPSVRQYAPDQKVLSDGLARVADSLQSIASRVPRMSQAVQDHTGNALRAMERAISLLDEREANAASGFQKTSMMHMNELALLLSRLLDQMKQQPSGAGSGSMQRLMQQLQQAAGQQQKLNKQIQEHLNSIQGERLSPDTEKRRQQLARQQREIQQQLEDMDVGSEARQRIMGDLEKIAEQMGESADDLEGGRQIQELIERQQQILTRLLNAQQSLRTRGKKEQRQGRTADPDFDRQRPGDRAPADSVETLRRDLIRALEKGYNPDYEELIKRYFKLLQEQDRENP